MTSSELRQIAAEMRRELPPVGRTERVISSRGAKIYLRLLNRHGLLQLFVGYRDAYPAPESAGHIADLFGAGDSEPRRYVITLASPAGVNTNVRCLVYAWRETALA